MYTPYVTSNGGESDYRRFVNVDSNSRQGTWAVESGNVVMRCNGEVFGTFKREGDDLIAASSGVRFIKIR